MNAATTLAQSRLSSSRVGWTAPLSFLLSHLSESGRVVPIFMSIVVLVFIANTAFYMAVMTLSASNGGVEVGGLVYLVVIAVVITFLIMFALRKRAQVRGV